MCMSWLKGHGPSCTINVHTDWTSQACREGRGLGVTGRWGVEGTWDLVVCGGGGGYLCLSLLLKPVVYMRGKVFFPALLCVLVPGLSSCNPRHNLTTPPPPSSLHHHHQPSGHNGP